MKFDKIDDNFRTWLMGIPYEIAFWNNVCRWPSTFYGMLEWSHYNKELQLDGFDVNDYLEEEEQPVILDIGSGMTFLHGNLIKTSNGQIPIEVHYIDPLAQFYNKFKRRYKRNVPDVKFGMMEFLSANEPANLASLAIISNALDHSYDPVKGVIEALYTLKMGGYLYLNHHPNEAETEKYKGFHKYNIDTDVDGHCVIWNKSKRIILDDIISPFSTIETKKLKDGHIVSLIKKIDNVPENLINRQDDLNVLTNQIACITSCIQQPMFLLKWTLTYWKYNIIQFFVQALSWKMKLRMRKILYG